MPAVGTELGKLSVLRLPAAFRASGSGDRLFGAAVGTEVALVFGPAFRADPAGRLRSLFPAVGAEFAVVYLAAVGTGPIPARFRLFLQRGGCGSGRF